MSDCDEIDGALPIRQGDILKRFGVETAEHFVVISADCDLAKNRLADSGVACLRMVPLRRYILEEYALKAAQKQLQKCTERLAERVQKIRCRLNTDCVPIGIERLAEWISLRSEDEICSALGVVAVAEPALVKEINSIRASTRLLASTGDYRAVDALCSLQASEVSRSAQAKSLLKTYSHKDLPIDAFFICDVPGETHLGFVVDFRALKFVSTSTLFTSASGARDADFAFLRIGRLAATFRHSLTQQFGFLFSRIGFPGEYERQRDETFAKVIEALTAEPS